MDRPHGAAPWLFVRRLHHAQLRLFILSLLPRAEDAPEGYALQKTLSAGVGNLLHHLTAMVAMFEVIPPIVNVTGTAKPGWIPVGTSALT